MNNFQDLIQQTAILGISDLSADFIIKSLKAIGLTDDDIKKFNHYSIKLSWILGLEGYSKNCTLPPLIKNVLQLLVIEIKDVQMQYDMKEFLNYPTFVKGKNLYDKIFNSIPEDIIKDFFEIITKLRNHIIKYQNQHNNLRSTLNEHLLNGI